MKTQIYKNTYIEPFRTASPRMNLEILVRKESLAIYIPIQAKTISGNKICVASEVLNTWNETFRSLFSCKHKNEHTLLLSKHIFIIVSEKWITLLRINKYEYIKKRGKGKAKKCSGYGWYAQINVFRRNCFVICLTFFKCIHSEWIHCFLLDLWQVKKTILLVF